MDTRTKRFQTYRVDLTVDRPASWARFTVGGRTFGIGLIIGGHDYATLAVACGRFERMVHWQKGSQS